MLSIFVTIVNFNSSEHTLSCLKSLDAVSRKDFDLNVVVVDNASAEPFDVLEKDYKNFKLVLIKSRINTGFAGGQNLAIKKALDGNADFIVVLNNDVILDKNFLINLLKTFSDKPDCGLVSPKIYFAKGHEFHKDRYEERDLGKVLWYAGGRIDWKNVLGDHRGVDEVDNGQYDKLEETDYVSGCAAMIKREVFEKTGLFDEKYFLYYEDNDLSQRARKSGFAIYFQPESYLWHLNAGSTGGSGSQLHDYYITRNRLLFGFRYASLRAKLALLKESIRLVYSGRKWQKRGALDFYIGKMGKGSFK